MSHLNKLDHIINTEAQEISQCARKMARWDVGGRKQILLTARKRMIDELQMYLPDWEVTWVITVTSSNKTEPLLKELPNLKSEKLHHKHGCPEVSRRYIHLKSIEL